MNKGNTLNKNLNNQQILNLNNLNAVSASFSEVSIQNKVVLPVVRANNVNGTVAGQMKLYINAANVPHLLIWDGTAWLTSTLT